MSFQRALPPKRKPSSTSFDERSGFCHESSEIHSHEDPTADNAERWSRMLPEILEDIIKRVEASADTWPARRSIVAFAGVCRRWREIALASVGSPLESGRITFPSSLKLPGTREMPIQCFIKRNRKDSTFYLYLSLAPMFLEKGKFLLAARKIRHGTQSEYIITLDADDLYKSNAYVGKLRPDFLGTNFVILDNQPPYSDANLLRTRACQTRASCKQISPDVPACNYEIGHVTYKFNLLKRRGPRRMHCTLHCPPQQKSTNKDFICNQEVPCVVLQNKAPRWHEHLQCWCLNFHGRVTVASVKNFQLAATVDPSQPGGAGDEDTVLLQFGKIGDDVFTMDYRQPLSAFQAFAICLTSFGTKIACE